MRIKIFIRGEFVKNAIVLITGTTISQVIPLIFSPILSRIYTSSDFALFGLYYSLVSVISSISAGTYEYAIVLPKTDNEAKNLMFLSFKLSLISSIFCLIIFTLFNKYICSLLQNNSISNWLYFVPLSVFILTLNTTITNWFNRKKAYKLMTINKLIRNGITTCGNLFFGLVKLFKSGLVIGQILGDFASSILFLAKFYKKENGFKDFSQNLLLKLSKEYINFPKFVLITTLLNNLSIQLPVILISSSFTASLTGAYFFSYRILSIPLAFISSSVSQVFYQRFSEIVRENRVNRKKFILKIWGFLLVLGFFPTLLLIFFGPELFAFLFGKEWKNSGEIASIMAPMFLFMFLSSPTSSTYIILNKQKTNVIFGIIVLIYRILAFSLGAYFNNFFLGLKILVFFEITQILVYNIFIFRKL